MNADTNGSTRFYTDDEGANVCEEDDECDADAAGANYGWETWEGPRERDCNTSFKMVQCQLKHPIYLYACGDTSHQVPPLPDALFVPNGLWLSNFDNSCLFADLKLGRFTFWRTVELTSHGRPPPWKCTNGTEPSGGFHLVRAKIRKPSKYHLSRF